jgi:hypothetical protein
MGKVMSLNTLPGPVLTDPLAAPEPASLIRQLRGMFEYSPADKRWSLVDGVAVLLLAVLWAMRMYATWATWGNLSIDGGHEMYVPAMLAQGKMLYRDVWYHYGPVAPYLNSYLFRLFGMRLEVLYWAGSLSALASAILLFAVGRELGSRVVGWTAGAVVILQAFHPSLFSFPLPYSFASVYGLLAACLFLWLLLRASTSTHWLWTFGAGTVAALALLLKLEYGMAAYLTLFVLIALASIQRRSIKDFAHLSLAILPGAACCALIIYWMISIRGADFITQENILSWPTSYFMKTFGQAWLESTGFTISAPAFLGALFRSIPIVAFLYIAYRVLWPGRPSKQSAWPPAAVALVLGAYFILKGVGALPFFGAETIFSTLFFPQDMVLHVILAALGAWAYYLYSLRNGSLPNPGIPLLLTFAGLLALRILMKMTPEGYPIYYNGPVVLSFLLLLCLLIPRSGHSRWFPLVAESIVCLACLVPVALHAKTLDANAKLFVPLKTERGTIRVLPQVADNYQAAIQFMKDANSRGESVLAVAEDTSLYFLSGIECPTRVYTFNPGVVAPGHMTDELLQEIDRKPVRYLLWSNRIYPEYGTPVFGKDFAQDLGTYFTSHYHRTGRLVPNGNNLTELSFSVWERRPEGEIAQ